MKQTMEQFLDSHVDNLTYLQLMVLLFTFGVVVATCMYFVSHALIVSNLNDVLVSFDNCGELITVDTANAFCHKLGYTSGYISTTCGGFACAYRDGSSDCHNWSELDEYYNAGRY